MKPVFPLESMSSLGRNVSIIYFHCISLTTTCMLTVVFSEIEQICTLPPTSLVSITKPSEVKQPTDKLPPIFKSLIPYSPSALN